MHAFAEWLGTKSFPAMSASGGEIVNLSAIVSPPSTPASILIDAAAIAGDTETIEIRTSDQTNIEMLDAAVAQSVRTGAGSLKHRNIEGSAGETGQGNKAAPRYHFSRNAWAA